MKLDDRIKELEKELASLKEVKDKVANFKPQEIILAKNENQDVWQICFFHSIDEDGCICVSFDTAYTNDEVYDRIKKIDD